MKIEIIDNFLPSYYNDSYMKTFSGVEGNTYSWYFIDDLNCHPNNYFSIGKKYKGNYYFSNCCYDVARGIEYPNQYPLYEPLLNRLNITMSNVKRIKTNLYPLSGRRMHHSTHVDYEPNQGFRTCLYYVHESNRLTIFDGKQKIKCKNNRAIIFDGSIPHHSTTPTDANYACSVNIDYWV